MLLLILGLTWCVTSVIGFIPPWTPICSQSDISNACTFGNLTVTLFSKTMLPKNCNSQVSIKEFQFPPVIHINSTNTTDRFTVMVVDLGPQGTGPSYLEWLVTNVSTTSLPDYKNIPWNNVIANYNAPLLMQNMNHRTLIQILVFRHHNVLRVPFGELTVLTRRNFSFRTLVSNAWPNLRLCGPVAGAQYWVVDSTGSAYTPSAPPLPAVQPVQPVYIPVVPLMPVGQAPAPTVVSAPASQPPIQPAPNQHQHVHTTFPKKSSASMSQPIQILFIPLVILSVMYL